MGEIAGDIQIVCAGMHSPLVLVPRWDNPSLHGSVIASSANFRLARGPSTTEYDRPHSVQVAPESKPDLESSFDFLVRVQRQIMLPALAP
jgi:hypothetical protein